jgi:Raf kinase inhibitor-like YbhB/YbcL family protein
MKILSDAFEPGGYLPVKYTCNGDNVSPALKIIEVSGETESMALIFDDPDAPLGSFTHWIIFNLSPATRELKENMPEDSILEGGVFQGRNSYGDTGYGGPCPPPGNEHRYYFRLYALDTRLDVGPGISRNELIKAMENHTIDQSELMVKFGR